MTQGASSRSRFLTAEWRDLVIANYEVSPSLLERYIPRGTSLDLWEGQALVSLVGFRFLDTRLLGVPVPGHRDFEEVNLRFYVRRQVGDEVRRGVVFIRELVPRPAIAWVARRWFNEPYLAVPMRHDINEGAAERSIRYEWHKFRGWSGITAVTHGPSTELVPGSKAEFITEHYWGYTAQRRFATTEYEVAHPRWRVWDEPEVQVHGDLTVTYGRALGAILSGPMDSAFVAVGSPVTVYRPRRIIQAG